MPACRESRNARATLRRKAVTGNALGGCEAKGAWGRGRLRVRSQLVAGAGAGMTRSRAGPISGRLPVPEQHRARIVKAHSPLSQLAAFARPVSRSRAGGPSQTSSLAWCDGPMSNLLQVSHSLKASEISRDLPALRIAMARPSSRRGANCFPNPPSSCCPFFNRAQAAWFLHDLAGRFALPSGGWAYILLAGFRNSSKMANAVEQNVRPSRPRTDPGRGQTPDAADFLTLIQCRNRPPRLVALAVLGNPAL